MTLHLTILMGYNGLLIGIIIMTNKNRFAECKDRKNRTSVRLPYSLLPTMAAKKLRDAADKVSSLSFIVCKCACLSIVVVVCISLVFLSWSLLSFSSFGGGMRAIKLSKLPHVVIQIQSHTTFTKNVNY
jgi:hypothetical protein